MPRPELAHRRARRRQDDSLWSLYHLGQGIDPGLLPPELRPIGVEEAITVLAQSVVDLDHDETMQWRGRLQLARAAGVENKLLERLNSRQPLTATDSSWFASQIADILSLDARVVSLLFPGTALVRAACFPCKEPQTIHYGGTLNTKTTAVIRVDSPLSSLRARLDPRNWKRCARYFRRSSHVTPADGIAYHDVDPTSDPALGKPWKGLLYEQLTFPQGEFRQILSVDFRPSTTNIRVDYSLYHPLRAEVGFLTTSGGMRKDSGYLYAVSHARTRTILTVTKTVSYRDLTRHDPSSTIDYGKIMSYLAPAALCLWVDDLGLLVPCCD
jgi:hypothetical protein